MLESFFNKVADLQVSRPGTLLKRDSSTGVFLWILQNYKEHPFWKISANECFYIKLSYVVMPYVLLCWKDVVFLTQFFPWFFFVTSKSSLLIIQNILTLFKLSPLRDKKKAHVKKPFDLFLLYLYDSFFSVLEIHYEKSCSTKGAAQYFTRTKVLLKLLY